MNFCIVYRVVTSQKRIAKQPDLLHFISLLFERNKAAVLAFVYQVVFRFKGQGYISKSESEVRERGDVLGVALTLSGVAYLWSDDACFIARY